MPANRFEFEKGVPDALFRKVGGQCSVPRCQNPAMGPSLDGSSAINMGVACHIFSAAQNGPRGRGGKDEQFICSEENGIWCCAYHASLIDKKKGKDYSADTLFAWKKLAEARILKQMNDIPSPLGWVESIEFTLFPLKQSAPPKIILSRRTLIYGKNGSGKSSLMQMAASVTHSRHGTRFNATKVKNNQGKYEQASFSFRAIYSTVDTLNRQVDVEITGDMITRYENRNRCLLPPGDVEFIYCSDNDSIKNSSEDDLEYFARTLDIDKSAVYALTEIGTKTVFPGAMKFEHDEDYDYENEVTTKRYKDDGSPYYALFFKKNGSSEYMPYAALSSSERARLIIDLFITKAREVSKQRLTLLFIDQIHAVFDESNFMNLLKAVSEEEFQVALTLHPHREKDVIDVQADDIYLQKHDYLNGWGLSVLE